MFHGKRVCFEGGVARTKSRWLRGRKFAPSTVFVVVACRCRIVVVAVIVVAIVVAMVFTLSHSRSLSSSLDVPLLYRYFTYTFTAEKSQEACYASWPTSHKSPCHFTLSRCAPPDWLCATPTPGTSTSGCMDCGVPRSVHQCININVYNQGKLGCWSASKAPECPPVDIKLIVV
jgi:hypothetical protein